MERLFLVSGICANIAIIYGVFDYFWEKKTKNIPLPISYVPVDESVKRVFDKETNTITVEVSSPTTEDLPKEEEMENNAEEQKSGEVQPIEQSERCPIEQQVEERLRRASDCDENTWSKYLPKFNNN